MKKGNYFLDNPAIDAELSNPEFLSIAENDKRIEIYRKALEIIGEVSAGGITDNARLADVQRSPGKAQFSKAARSSLKLLTHTGAYGMTIPVEYGGLGFPTTVFMAAIELISRADAGIGAAWTLQACSDTIFEFADENLRSKWLPLLSSGGSTAAMALTEADAGSDLQSVAMKATMDEQDPTLWYLNGTKRFITCGNARMVLVLARSEAGSTDGRGLSLFVYDRNDGNVTFRRVENKMGIRSSVTVEMVFSNTPARLVGETRLGLIKYVMSLMNGARLAVAAQSVGIAEAAYRDAISYASTRIQFGRPIAEFPQVDQLIRGIASRLAACRALLYETARFVDLAKFYSSDRKLSKQYRQLSDAFTPLAKFITSEFAFKAASDSLQVHGGSGYMKNFRVERLLRDARVTSIYEGTSQMQIIAAMSSVQKGVYSSRFEYYAGLCNDESRLIELQHSFDTIVATAPDKEYCARTIVTLAAYVAMSYLLYIKSGKCKLFDDFVLEAQCYAASASVFVNNGYFTD